jgi:hypothetical protein
LLDAATGAERWRVPLSSINGNDVVALAVGETTVHAELQALAGPEIVTFAALDGRQLWRARPSAAGWSSPREPHTLLTAPGRVFHYGHEGDVASIVTGFEAETGKLTVKWSVGQSVWRPLVVPAGAGPLLLTTGLDGTAALGPMAPRPHRRFTISGTVRHSADSEARRLDLAGVEICVGQVCATTDAQGRYTLEVDAGGVLGADARLDRYVGKNRGRLPPLHRYMERCPRHERARFDSEVRDRITWDPAVHVTQCPQE